MRRNTLVAELFAEFLGTFTLIVFGVGVVASVVLGNGRPSVAEAEAGPFGFGGAFGDFTTINWAWGFGVVLGVYVAGGISGAHINPAVTLALAVRRGFPWGKVPYYWLAQLLGAFIAALLIRWNFMEWFNLVDPETGYATQGVFSTSPGEDLGVWGGFRSEVIGTMMLVIGVLAITDTRNLGPMSNLAPLIIGLLVVVIGMSLGPLSGYAINPARDFGPRLAAYFTGFGETFRSATEPNPIYWWVPIVGPLIGGVIGAYVYDWFIGRFLPLPAEEEAAPAEAPGQPATERAERA